MKKLFFFVILSEVLFALTISIQRNDNSIIPYNLRLGSNETLITFSSKYDTLTHKSSISAHLHLYIKLFSKEKRNKIKNKDSNQTKFFTYKYKSSLGIRMRDKVPHIELKNSFKFNYKRWTFYEEITPALPMYYNEQSVLEYRYNNKMFFINKTFTYKKNGMDYSFGIDFYKLYLPKFVRTVSVSLNGNTSKAPFIYSYNISTSYRFSIMHKKYFYLNINPYILISKKYNFKIKPAIKLSLNYDF